MSAFYCEDSTITKCVTAFQRYGTGESSESGANESGESGASLVFDSSTLGHMLREMNVEALKQRYGERLGPEELDTRYEFPGEAQDHPAALLKALNCLHYQCSEGNVPKRNPLYKTLERVQEILIATESPKLRGYGRSDIRKTPEYEQAPWG